MRLSVKPFEPAMMIHGRTSAGDDTALVLCPMRIEHDAVARQIARSGLEGVRVLQTGVGKDAIVAAMDRSIAHQGRPELVVLAGAAGGLAPTVDVPPIARIVDEHGHSWRPAIGADDPGGVTLAAVDSVISTPGDKAAVARRLGAQIVDMESHALARRCEELELPLVVVRGVSDTPDETLPSRVIGWLTPEGDTRAMRAAIDLAISPRLIPHIVRVLRRSRRVLPLVGRRVVEMIERARRERRVSDPRAMRSPAVVPGS